MALAILFILIPLLLILVLTLFIALDAGNGFSGKQYGKTACLYAAESGLAHAVAELRNDSGWVTGFSSEPMAHTSGTYSVTFNQSGPPFNRLDSVNNTDGAHPHSPLGSNTVPAGMVLLTVSGQVGAHRQAYRYLVGPEQTTFEVGQAILASGRIRMQGDTSINGFTSLDQPSRVDAHVQTNSSASGTLVEWQPDGGSLLIDGSVRTPTSTASVDLQGYSPSGGIDDFFSASPPPAINIQADVIARRSATAFPPGSNVVPAGENYHSGSLAVTGDLVLQGDLYVEGDLTITGSISGAGSVYVTGETSFYGDATIGGQNNVSLLSQGSITLEGFDGDAYLDGIAAGDPEFNTWLVDARWALNEVETRMLGGAWSGFDIGIQDVSSVLGPQNTAWNSDYPGRTGASLWRMRDRVQSLPAGPARDFMVEKLDSTGAIFLGNGNILGESDAQTRDKYLNTGDTAGLLDAANDLATDMPLKLSAYGVTQQISNDRLGTSYFQGLLYTNGALYAANQVTVIGAVAVVDNGTQADLSVNGQTYQPGDLSLTNGARITYAEGMFTDSSGTSSGPLQSKTFFGTVP